MPMPIHPEYLSRYFDQHMLKMREEWDSCVDAGTLTDNAFHFRLSRLEEIGAILRSLAEGQAVLTYKPKPQREPAPLIRLLVKDDD
jgi:hypothetical protein